MPVVRSRSGIRMEAGRGYPRLKWSDINKSTIIGNALHCEKQEDEEEVELRCHASNNSHLNGERRAEAKRHSSSEWNQKRHGVLIQSDGESDENSSDNSLICSDFRVSPDNGKVKMALTVPLGRLASSPNRHQAVLESTLRIKHTTQIQKDSKGVEQQNYLNSSLCAAGRCSNRILIKDQDSRELVINSKKDDKSYHSCKQEISSLPFGFRDAHIFLCENKESFRPPTFWHDVRACKKGCLASQKNRLRDGTFIISPSNSDSNIGQKRRGLKKLPRNSLYPANVDHLNLSMERNLAKALPVRLDLNNFPLSSKLDKYSKNKRVANIAADSTPLEVRFHYQRGRPLPITYTSASHSGSRCYPPMQCHPSPKCHPFPKPFHVPHFYKVHHCTNPKYLQHSLHPISQPHEKESSKKKSVRELGLTIRNRHASMESDEEDTSPIGCKKKWDFVQCFTGQRVSSSGDVTTLPKRPSNNPQSSSSSSPSQAGTPNHSPAVHAAAGNSSARGKKALKTTLKETPSRKTFQLKTKYSNPLATNSPASLHGKVLQKTATVSPAPHKNVAENSPNTLTRFGFKSSPLITSGDSTDSVNSILSDAQTTSDANSNIFDFGEKNRNGINDLETKLKLDTQNSSTLNVRSVSPCTISQASSGVTSSLLNGKIKAQTKHLPSPQTVTVKEMNKNTKKQTISNGPQRTRYSSPTARKNSSPQRSPAVMPKEHRSKIPQNLTKSSLAKSQKVSKDIESSNRSLNTIDSGLGSSLESEKLRSPKLLAKAKTRVLDTDQEPDTKENKLHLDVSDEWLKERHSRLESKGRLNPNSRIFEESLSQNIPKNSSKSTKESFKDKRDSNITYGMARQKFAPYSRYRFTYQTPNNNNKSSANSEKITPKTESTFQFKSTVTGGTVRSRIAQIEKTPLTSATTPSLKAPKRPIARPTSIEKTPILVNSKTENTIELSRSICRRLEYSEGKSSLHESTKDNKNESYLIEVPTTAQDLLMVDSYELKKDLDEKSESELIDTNKMAVSLPDEKSLKIEKEISEEKRIKDSSECENKIKRYSEDGVDFRQNPKEASAFLHLNLPDSAAKVFSPDGSETSFEVLESGSVDISPRDETDVICRNEEYLTQLVSGLANSTSDGSSSAKHSQSSPLRVVPLKKCRQDSDNNNKEGPICDETTNTTCTETQDNYDSRSKSIMESSTESNRSDSNRMSDSCGDRWTVSGKCTPSIGSTRGDADQDFLIDDEISDQPGLTFGDDLDASLFGDEDLFSDISSPSATHILSKSDRSRHASMGTASSLGPDDLMLDYDPEDSKPYGSPKQIPSAEKPLQKSTTKESAPKKKNKNIDIVIPGPRYEEEVLSPVACDILSEWSAILSGGQSDSSPLHSPTTPCVSQQTGVVSSACSNSVGVGLCSSPSTQTTNVTTLQPQTAESPPLSRAGSFSSRSRTCSVGPDFASSDKRGVNLKPPRQGISSEHDGGLNIDRTTLHYICQDVTTMKTLLHRLRRVLQVTDTINPFDANLKTSLYLNLGSAESSEREDASSVHEVVQQNVDLKRQVVLLQQRLEEKDRTIRSLQQQLTQSLQKSSTSSINTLTNSSCLLSPDDDPSCSSSSSKSLSNAATQTERNNHRSSPFTLAAMSRTSSVEDGLGPTVSFENSTPRRLLNENSFAVIDDLEKEEEEESLTNSHRKKYPSEFVGSSPSPKLSLVPLNPPTVSEFMAS